MGGKSFLRVRVCGGSFDSKGSRRLGYVPLFNIPIAPSEGSFVKKFGGGKVE